MTEPSKAFEENRSTLPTLPKLRGGWERVGWALLAMGVATASAVSACSGSGEPAASPSGDGPADDGAAIDSSAAQESNEGDRAVVPATIPTEANLKVAFIGDTASGDDFRSVLQLVKREGAELVMVQGDLTYDGAKPPAWFSTIDSEINAASDPGAPVTIPYFASKGNHDTDWSRLGDGLKSRLAAWNIAPEHNDPTVKNYAVVYKGLKVVMVSDSTTSPSREEYINQRLTNDAHIWKICSWHKNQKASNVGGKSDEMGWTVYENCRKQGAIVAQGHSHTYSRSKTITNDANQTVDPTCADPFDLCVAPGKHFFFDSSLGGHDMRSKSSVANKSYWGTTYTGSFGALFVEFNVDGDPRKARGYFKTVDDVIVDPPASSGRTTFTITRAP